MKKSIRQELQKHLHIEKGLVPLERKLKSLFNKISHGEDVKEFLYDLDSFEDFGCPVRITGVFRSRTFVGFKSGNVYEVTADFFYHDKNSCAVPSHISNLNFEYANFMDIDLKKNLWPLHSFFNIIEGIGKEFVRIQFIIDTMKSYGYEFLGKESGFMFSRKVQGEPDPITVYYKMHPDFTEIIFSCNNKEGLRYRSKSSSFLDSVVSFEKNMIPEKLGNNYNFLDLSPSLRDAIVTLEYSVEFR